MPARPSPDQGRQTVELRIIALEERLKALEEWKSDVMTTNPHLATVLDTTPRGEASDE